MTVQRSSRFETDLENQFRWYLVETDLDPTDASALAYRFSDAVDEALVFLERNPASGRRRFSGLPGFAGVRSWRVQKQFDRFISFYRVEEGILFAERLLEGHSKLAGGR